RYNGSFLKKKAVKGTTVTTGALKESQQFFFEAVGAKKRVVEESIFIQVYPPVKIESFTADPLEIMQGEEVTLSWEVVHATSVSIPTYGAQLPGKSLRVPPVASGPIELIVEGHVANDQARAQVSVMVYPHPIVHFFEASRSKVLEGEKMEISWKVENARTVYLWDGGKEVAVPSEGKRIYQLYQTTDYVLRVVDLLGNSEARHKYYTRVSVCQPAKLEHFEVLTPKTNHGGEIQLAWEAPHAQEVWLSWNNLDPIEVTSKQGIKLPAYNDTDEPLEIAYTLSIVDELGNESISPNPQRATVYPTPFWVIYPPSLVQVKEGQTYTLEAKAHHAQKLFVLEGENTEEIKAGSIRLTPHRDTVYKLIAKGFDSQVIISKDIEVRVWPAVKISFFRSNMPFVFEGQHVNLTWEVSGHTDLIIQPGNIKPNGQQLEVQVSDSQAFTLTATNPCDQDHRSITVKVLPPPTLTNLNLPEVPVSLLTTEVQAKPRVFQADFSKVEIKLPVELTFSQYTPIEKELGRSMESLMRWIDFISFVPLAKGINRLRINLLELFQEKKSKLQWKSRIKR
ncbi:MAG: hypothetical protein AAFU33_27820, partial [Bacteroidota bacterium]